MSRPTSWSDLVLGSVAMLVVIGAALAILMFARIGTLHGDASRLYLATGEARGIIPGSEVWVGGQKVGIVKGVDFLPPGSNEQRKLLISMDVLTSAMPSVRRDSRAQIHAGSSLIGAPVVALSVGTSGAPPVEQGDTLQGLPQTDTETMTSEFAMASREFPAILANLKLLNDQLHGTDGALGAISVEQGGTALSTMRSHFARLDADLARPRGAIGAALQARGEIVQRARMAMARADSVRALVASDRSSLGRFRKDSALMSTVADLRNELDIVRARVADPNGTIGRARADSVLLREIDHTRVEMTRLVADIKRHPLRYIRF